LGIITGLYGFDVLEYREIYKWAAANFFDGIIDELAFYGTAQTEAEWRLPRITGQSDSLLKRPAINCLFTGEK